MKKYVFRDSCGKKMAKYYPLQLPIKEEVIIHKSIEMFKDKEPCIINRTYIMKKLMIEIDSIVDELFKVDLKVIKIKDGIIWEYIDIPKNVSYIDVYYDSDQED